MNRFQNLLYLNGTPPEDEHLAEAVVSKNKSYFRCFFKSLKLLLTHVVISYSSFAHLLIPKSKLFATPPPHPPPPNNVISPGYYIRRKRNSKQRLYKMLKGEGGSKRGVLFEICENWSIRRTAVADKEKFDDEFCSEFKYDIF